MIYALAATWDFVLFNDAARLFDLKCLFTLLLRYREHFTLVLILFIFHMFLRKVLQLPLRIHWRLLMISETGNKSVWSNVFWYVKVYISWKFVQSIINWDKTQMLKKFSLDKINVTKMHSFLFCELQLISFLLICNSYASWSGWFISRKLNEGFSIFDSAAFLWKFILLFNEIHGRFDFKTSWFLSK